ncbi:MAG: hypothetical protein ACYTGB_15345 [Planctomycetota bacterium]|jgi:hypothetical protein
MHTKPIAVLALAAMLACAGLSPAGEKKRPREKLVLRVYDVQELVLTIPDFPGPDLDMAAANSGALPVFQGVPPRPSTDPQEIAQFITRRVQPESWGEGWGTHIAVESGRLIVLQTPTVHRRITALLATIRADGCRRLVVRGMIVAVDGKTAARLRGKASEPMEAGEVEKLVAAAGPDSLLASPQVICANGQRAHAWLGQQSAYVGSYSVSGNTPCPNIHQLLEGTVFDVRPTLSFDGTSADVVLRFTVADDRNDRRKEFFFLTDDSGDGAAAGAEEGKEGEKVKPRPAAAPALLRGRVKLPDVRVLRLRSTVSVPLGKYTLAGSLPLPVAEGEAAKSGKVGLVLVTVSRARGGARAGGGDDEGRMITRVYDVRELTGVAWNFPGPHVGLRTSPAGGAGAVLAPPPPAILAMPSDALAAVVTKSIEPDSWGREGASIRSTQEQLVVTHTPAVQARIRALLAKLREECRPQVSMNMLVVAVSDKVAAGVRRRSGNQFTPAEAEKLLAGKGNVLLAAPQLRCSNNQRVHAYAGRQVTYVSGFSSSGSVSTPDISTAVHGWVFDVRPSLSPDRAAATVELRFTMTGDTGASEELSVELTPAAGKRPAVTNHLTAPKAEIISVRNSISVPVGKYVLAGTWRRKAQSAKAAPNLLVLLRAELIPAGGK